MTGAINIDLSTALTIAGALFTIICALIGVIHNHGMGKLDEIDKNTSTLANTVANHANRLTKLETLNDTCEEKHEDCHDDRGKIHKRITKIQGAE